MTRKPLFLWPAAFALALGALTACGNNMATDSKNVDSMPQAWLADTADGWPDADGFGASMPVLERTDECLLFDEMPEFLGETAKVTSAGWGRLGADRSDKNSYRYICDIWSRDNYAGSVHFMQAADAQAADDLEADFRDQPSIPEQDNTVSEETSGKLDMTVLKRWYPTNPQGMYTAAFYDEDANAIVQLEINSLDKDDFESTSPQGIADLLHEIITQNA